MIRLYHSPLSRSVRVLWLLEELGLQYDLVTVDFTPEYLQSPAYRRIHPLGKVPAIEDGDLTMFESGAIVEYLVERYGQGRLAPPPGDVARGPFFQWLHFSETTALPPLGDFAQHTMLRPKAERNPTVADEARSKVAVVLEILDRQLAGKTHLIGSEFLAVDVMIGYAVKLMMMLGLLPSEHANVCRYLQRLEQRPAFQKALG